MKDGLKDKYRQAIIDILSQCEQVEKVVLFGSRAMGTFTITSDVDIVLFGDKLTLTDQGNLAEQIEELTMPQSADLLLYRTIESKELLKHIREYGVQWWPEKNEQRGLAMERNKSVNGEGRSVKLPNGWEEKTLGDIADIEMGQSPTGNTCNKNGKGIPLLNGPTEFGSNHPTPIQFTTDPRKFAARSDLLFCVRGSTTGRMNWADQKYAIGRGLAAIRHKNGGDYQSFIKGIIDYHLPVLLSSATGSTFPNVSRNQLIELPIKLPPLTEQKAIAHILGSLDDKIELNRRMNETLEAMAQALFKSWFVDFDPVIDNALAAGNEIPEELKERADIREALGDARKPLPEEIQNLFPSEFEHTEEMGWIPKGWRVSQLEKIAKFTNGKTSPDRSTGVIPVFGSNGCIGYSTEHNRDDVVIVGRVGTYCGSLHYCRTLCWVTDNAMIAEMNNKEHNTYLLELLKLANLNDRQGGSGQPLLNQTILGLIKFIKPSDEIISQFTRHSFEFYKKINFNEQIISNTSNLRDTLLPQLLTGEMRIPEAEKLVEEIGIMRDEL